MQQVRLSHSGLSQNHTQQQQPQPKTQEGLGRQKEAKTAF